MKLPRVTPECLKAVCDKMVIGDTSDPFNIQFNREKLDVMCRSMEKDNPELTKFIIKSGNILRIAQEFDVDFEWLFLMICITMYKALEEAQTYNNN